MNGKTTTGFISVGGFWFGLIGRYRCSGEVGQKQRDGGCCNSEYLVVERWWCSVKAGSEIKQTRVSMRWMLAVQGGNQWVLSSLKCCGLVAEN